MMHRKRCWCIEQATSAEQLARDLTEMTWCGCNGFELDGYWFLNDATAADGAQEYAVVKQEGPGWKPLQVESLTMSWMTYKNALDLIRRCVAGEYDGEDFAHEVGPHVETAQEHGRCHLCG